MCSISGCPFDIYIYESYVSIYCIKHEFVKIICIKCNKNFANKINNICPDCIMEEEKHIKPIVIPLYLYEPTNKLDKKMK